MSQSVGVSARSFVIAGMSAAVVGAAAVTPVSAPALNPARMAALAVQHTSITTPLENAIKNTYNAVEPWVAYGVSWVDYVAGLIPVVNLFSPAIPLAYNTIEPLVRAGTYSFADVVGLNFGQVIPDISTGINDSVNNFITGILNWANIPVPPPLPGASVPASAAGVAPLAGAVTPKATSGIESAIKNTYNALEPWAAWGAELIQWGMSFVPGLWWVAPGVSLAYFSIEPLVQAGVYTVADILGLNFSQIGPDITSGIQQSVQNAVTYGLAWLQSLIPFPPLPPFPPRPFAAVTAPAATRAAAAISAPEATTTAETPAPSATPAADKPAAVSDATGPDATATSDKTAPVVDATPVTEPAPAVDSTPAPEAVTPASVEAPSAPAADPAPVANEASRPSRAARPGHRSPAGADSAASKSGADSSSDAGSGHGGRSAG